jgi:hypothetical protein
MTPPGGEYSTYRFDYYSTNDNPISWKDEVDQLPEFDIDFEATRIETLIESKGDEYYYPGCILNLNIVREPWPVFFVYLLPASVLFIFLQSVFYLTTGNLENR